MIEKIIKMIKGTLSSYRQTNFIHGIYKDDYKSPKVNLGQIQGSLNSQKKISDLCEVEFQVFSQFGDDGIIDYLTGIIPFPNKTFIEFGVEDYRESNTRFLLINKYWSGLVIDGSEENIKKIKSEQFYNFYDIEAVCSFITKENINGILMKSGFHEEIGILSIDIDGNDFWIWKEINSIRPIIFICEYNSLFGFDKELTIPYDEQFVRGNNFKFNFYGTSLRAVTKLSTEKGYTLIGSNSAGNNVYFIRNDYMKYIPFSGKKVEEVYKVASFTEAWEEGEALRGSKKFRSINGLPIYNVLEKKIEKLDSYEIIASLIKKNKNFRD
jgi:hypothetical protein